MKMKRIMKSTRGEGYIDLAVAVLVLVFVLVIAISLWSAITLKQDMRYMCEELIATATSTGKVGEEVEQRFAELCEETGITPTVTWNTTYYNATKKQVQLGEIITCTLTHEITLQGFGTFTLPFSVTRWKPDRKKKPKLRRRKKSRKGISVGEILRSQIPQQKKYENRK